MKRIILFFSLFIFASASYAANGLWTSTNYAPLEAWGDSLTQGNQDGTGVTYPNALALLYSPARTVQNQGIGGETSSQILLRFQAAPSTWGFGSLIWMGRNNIGASAQIQSDIATMVSDLTSPNYVIMAIINGEGEGSGTSNYDKIVAINSALSATYGARYIDVRSALVAAYNPANGADVIDHTNDVPPFSLRAIDLSGSLSGTVSSGATSFTTVPVIGGAPYAGAILTVGSEYIYVNSVSGNVITNCIRGYGGTSASAYSNGQSYAGTDTIHLSAAGYTLVAQSVYAKIQQLGAW